MLKQISRCLIKTFKAIFKTENRRGKINPKSIKRVLLMGNDKLGDTIVLTPVFNALKAINNEIEIDCFGYDASYDVLLGESRLSKIYRYKQDVSIARLCRVMRQREYDLILSLTWRKGLREGLLALWGSVEKTSRVTIYRKPKYAPFWHKMVRVPTCVHHTADKYLYLLAQILDISELPRVQMSISTRPDSIKRVEQILSDLNVQEFILINLSAGTREMTKDELRCWTKEQYLSLILMLFEQRLSGQIVIVSLPQDAKYAQWIQSQCISSQGIGNNLVLFPETTDVHDLIALVSKAKMLISPDTSFIHIASAVGTPTVGLFSNRGKVETWGSYNIPCRMVAASPNDYHMTPLSKISVDSVFQSVLDLISEINDTKNK